MVDPLRHSNEEEKRRPIPGDRNTSPEDSSRRFIEETFVVEEVTPTRSERLGSAVGGAVASLHSRVRSGMRVVAGKSKSAKGSLEEMRTNARQRARDLSRDARSRMDEFRQDAQRRMRDAKAQTQRTVHEHPLETILAIAGVAIAAGFLLRVWRSNRD